MKGYYFPIVVVLILLPNTILAQSSDGDSSTLKVIVHDHYTLDLLDNAWVSLYHHGEIVDSVLTNQAGEALFNITTTSLGGFRDQIPQEFTLSPNFPNPFLEDTRVELGVPFREQIRVEVYNILGQRMSLHSYDIMPGMHTLAVSMGNLSTGVYFLRMTGGQTGQRVVKMTKTGLGHAIAGQVTMSMNAGGTGNILQASLNNASSDYSVYTRKESYETSKVDLDLSADITIEVPLERLNRIVVNVEDEFSEQVQKNITVTGVDFETSFFSPDTLILKSGSYNLTASADETSELNQEFEIVSRDTTLKLIVERSTTVKEMVVFPDLDRAVSKYIDSEGGAITAIAGDGTEYILEIPKDALHENTLITLAPVASIEGYPFAETPFGVGHLEPDGLRLFKPANLTIIPQGGYDLDEFVTFAYDGMGADVHFYPMSALTETAVSFNIMSFSGYGGGNATEQEQQQQQNRKPSKDKARLDHEVARHLNKMHKYPDEEGQCADPATEAYIYSLYMDVFNNVIMPRLRAAETNDAILFDAIREFLEWEIYLQLYGPFVMCSYYDEANPFYPPEAVESIKKGFSNALEKSHERCVDNFDPREVSKMLLLEAESQRLGFLMEEIDTGDEVEKCLTFEVDFSSQIRDESGGSWNSYVRSLDIELFLSDHIVYGMYEGGKELEYVLYENIFDGISPCGEKLIGTKNSTIYIDLLMQISFDSTGTENQTKIDMIIDPAAPLELWEVRHTLPETGECSSPETEEGWEWVEWFRHFHREKVTEDYRDEPPGFKVMVRDWVTHNEGEIFAEKIIQREFFGTTEDTRIYLRHAPKE